MTLEEAYRIYLGREPDAGGLAANKQLYGNELDNWSYRDWETVKIGRAHV